MSKHHLREECGIFGFYRGDEQIHAGETILLGTFALQHRGQEAAGFAIYDGEVLNHYKDLGLVEQVFLSGNIRHINGIIGIGHVRYSTRGKKGKRESAQPFVFFRDSNPVALVHNGNLTNHSELRKLLQSQGVTFVSDSDSESMLHLYIRSGEDPIEALSYVYEQSRGAFSAIIMDGDRLIAFRDPYGFRPLAIGVKGTSVVFSSENSAFDLIGFKYIGDVKPGEAVLVDKNGMHRVQVVPPRFPHHCIFELIYFSRPDSIIFGEDVYEFRKNTGRKLALKESHSIDIVVPVPDSGLPAAIGYAQTINKNLELGLIRSHYLGRSFIEPKQESRSWTVKLKLLPLHSLLSGKSIALIDDSIVRGTTSREIVKRIREAGAREIHIRIASPPLIGSCPFGIDIPTRDELIASNLTIDQIKDFLGVDSLVYLSVEELLDAAKKTKGFCTGCFTLDYPGEVKHEIHSSTGFRQRK